MDLSTHIIQFRKNNNKSNGKPSSHLNVEMTEVQEEIFNNSANIIL